MEKRIVISGASGLVGAALVPALENKGYEVLVLVRRNSRAPHEISWDPSANEIDLSQLNDVYGFINLSGENVAGSRWTPDVKKRILASRIETTSLLVEAVNRIKNKPTVFLNASATGFYGDRGDEVLGDSAKPGKGYLSDVCIAWENEAMKVSPLGIRTCLMRFGIILSSQGGALKKMLPLFKAGLGGALGDGAQYMSWITLTDVVRGIEFLLENQAMSGPVNFTVPEAISNKEFSIALARVLKKPCFVNAPAFALKMVFGEMAESLLLAGSRVEPQKLKGAGFEFLYPEISSALKYCLSL